MARYLIVCGGAGRGALGHHSALGFDAEFQIDAENQLVSKAFTPEKLRNLEAIGEFGIDDVYGGSAATCMTDIFYGLVDHPAATAHSKNHSRYLCDQWPLALLNLTDGLSRSPALGGAVFFEPDSNYPGVYNLLSPLVADGTEFFIVSSTAGGTGAGIHHHVAKMLIDISSRMPGQPNIRIVEIRIGRLSFQSIDQFETTYNTFMGLAADLGFLRSNKRWNARHQQWTHRTPAPIQIKYTELPDHHESYEMRDRDAGVMLTALFNEDVLAAVRPWLNNGVGQFKAGFFGRPQEWDPKTLLRESLSSLIDRVEILQEGTEASQKTPPLYKPPHGNAALVGRAGNPEEYVQAISRAKFTVDPRPNNEDEWRARLQSWKDTVSALLAQVEIGDMTCTLAGGQTETVQEATFTQQLDSTDLYGDKWFKLVNHYHLFNHWREQHYAILPANTAQPNKYIALMRLAEKCEKAVRHGSPTDKAKALSNREHLSAFVEALVEALTWQTIKDAGEQFWQQLNQNLALENLRQELIRLQREEIGRPSPPLKIISAPLDWGEGHLPTLLRRLMDNLPDTTAFKNTIGEAARGLTRAGLLEVLQLDANATTELIRTTLEGDGNKQPGRWFNDVEPENRNLTKLRIVPWLEPALMDEIDYPGALYKVIPSSLGTTGLYVLSIEGAPPVSMPARVGTGLLPGVPVSDPVPSASPQTATGGAPPVDPDAHGKEMVRLARPLTSFISRNFDQWHIVAGEKSPKFQLLKTFSSYDWIDLEFLINTGWSDEMILKLAPYANFISANMERTGSQGKDSRLQKLKNDIAAAAAAGGKPESDWFFNVPLSTYGY